MNDNDRLKTARKILGEFGIAISDVADGYNCTLEARQSSGGLGHHKSEEPSKESQNGMSPFRAPFYG